MWYVKLWIKKNLEWFKEQGEDIKPVYELQIWNWLITIQSHDLHFVYQTLRDSDCCKTPPFSSTLVRTWVLLKNTGKLKLPRKRDVRGFVRYQISERDVVKVGSLIGSDGIHVAFDLLRTWYWSLHDLVIRFASNQVLGCVPIIFINNCVYLFFFSQLHEYFLLPRDS